MNKNKKQADTNNLSDLEGLNDYTDAQMRKWGRRAIVGAAVAGFLVAALPNADSDSGKPENTPAHVQQVEVVELANNPQEVIVAVGEPPVPPVGYNN